MPTSNYNSFERWLDDMFGSHIKTYVSVNSISTKNEPVPIKKEPIDPFAIRSVLSNRNKNAFTVVWADGTHTTVHCQSGDDWDDEKALAMCFTKKALGNKGNFNDKFNDALDNKMKVIPAEKAPEKECKCDSACKVCECKMTVASVGKNRNGSYLTEEAIANASTEEIVSKKPTNAFGVNKQAADELANAALKATSSFKEMVEALANEPKQPLRTYKVFIRIGGMVNGESFFDSEFTSIEALRERVHEIAEEHYGRKPYYYRTWMNGNRMMVDFGHYTQFIEIEGITPSEYAKN